MKQEEQPSYYAIIPAEVRYDERLTANAKLLYGEITSLCNKEGYCWATNDYFANLYKVSKTSISMWIKSLADYGYINIKIDNKNKENLKRYLSIVNGGIKENLNTSIKENLKYNNTIKNNKNNTLIEEIIAYLNDKASKNYRPTTTEYRKNINARLNEGYTFEDFKTVIDKKSDEWIGTDMEQYLTPTTLFAPSKFDKYLNQTITKRNIKSNNTIKSIKRESGYIDSDGAYKI